MFVVQILGDKLSTQTIEGIEENLSDSLSSFFNQLKTLSLLRVNPRGYFSGYRDSRVVGSESLLISPC